MTTPNTINTIDDICQLLDANPEMAAALNQRLRGPDQAAIQEQLNQAIALAAATAQTTAENSRLIQEIGVKQDRNAAQIAENSRLNASNARKIDRLTDKVDHLAETTAENSRFMAQLSAKVDRNAEQIAELRQTTADNSRLITELGVKVDRLTETTTANSEQIAANSQKIAELGDKVDQNTANIANLLVLSQNTFSRMDRMEQDNSKLKSMLTEAKADDIMATIADELNWEQPTRITKAELIQIARNQVLDRDTHRSFTQADLVFHAQDARHATNYCAVAISWTVDQRDLNRARRNAELLTQFTGCPAKSAVYGDRYEWNLTWHNVAWFPE